MNVPICIAVQWVKLPPETASSHLLSIQLLGSAPVKAVGNKLGAWGPYHSHRKPRSSWLGSGPAPGIPAIWGWQLVG